MQWAGSGRAQERLQAIFLSLSVYLKGAEGVLGAAVLEITLPSFLRTSHCLAWGRLAGKKCPRLASGSTVLPALPSKPCTCSGAPLVGLCVALQDLLGDFNGPVPPRAHPCTLQSNRREVREEIRVAFLFPGSSLPFLCNRKRRDLGGGGTEIPFIRASSGESQL